MTTPNILTDTAPVVDRTRPGFVHSTITDAWGLFYAQGGVVMAAALRAMEAVLDRSDLRLASASATFCRPVACGPVTTAVEVLRNGRRGAQVHGALRDPADPEGGTNVVLTAVFTDPSLPGPTLTPVPRPDELVTSPPAEARSEMDTAFPLGFMDNTEWQVAEGDAPSAGADAATSPGEAGGILRRAVWFRFTDPPAPAGEPWDPALLPIPGDSLGTALVGALGTDGEPVGSVSLQIGVQVYAPMEGTWIGVDSTCTQVGNGLAHGVLDLWSEAGVHVATVIQTAMLRSFAA